MRKLFSLGWTNKWNFRQIVKKMGILLRNGIHFLQHSVQFAETLSEVRDEEKLVCDNPVLAEQRCVSLLKSKSGFLIRKRIFRFFAKIRKQIIRSKWSTTEMDSLDHIQNRILTVVGCQQNGYKRCKDDMSPCYRETYTMQAWRLFTETQTCFNKFAFFRCLAIVTP